MARVYREADVGNEIAQKRIAVLGFGSQGHAHALNLKESGCEVTVGLYEGSKSWPKAEEAGLKIMTTPDAVRWAEVVMMLLPDERQPAVYRREVEPNLTEGDLLLFAHGFNIHFNQIMVSPEVDLGLVAPKVQATSSGGSTSRARVFRRSSRSATTHRGRRGTSSSPTPAVSAAREPGFSRRPSPRRRRRIFLASRRSCAAA